MEFHVFMWKSREKLESHARVDFTGGCKSIVFHKVLGAVSPSWGGILLNYQILWKWVEFDNIAWKWWLYSISSSVGWKWCPGGPGAETSTKPMLFLCLFSGSDHPKVGFVVDFHQKAGSGVFLVQITKMGGIPRNSTISRIIKLLGVPRGPGPQKGMGFVCIIKVLAMSAGGRRKCRFYMFYHDFTWFH